MNINIKDLLKQTKDSAQCKLMNVLTLFKTEHSDFSSKRNLRKFKSLMMSM